MTISFETPVPVQDAFPGQGVPRLSGYTFDPTDHIGRNTYRLCGFSGLSGKNGRILGGKPYFQRRLWQYVLLVRETQDFNHQKLFEKVIMKRSIWFLSSLRIQSLHLGAWSLCLLASGCVCHSDWVREPFGPGTGPSLEHCSPGHGCGGCGGCATRLRCETECCDVGCESSDCNVGCGACDMDCGSDNNCAPPATLCNRPGAYRRSYGPGPTYHHGPITWVFGLLGFGGCGGCAHGGCGDMYWGEFHGDPPDVCDPCDCYGNYTGGCCGCGDQVYPPRPGRGSGCSDCMTGETASDYQVSGEQIYSEAATISPSPAVSPSSTPRMAPRANSSPSPGTTVPATGGSTGRINYNLPPGAKIISETDHVQTAAPRPTLAPRRR